MTRDYRYGHKSKATKVRRTQESSSPVESKVESQPSTSPKALQRARLVRNKAQSDVTEFKATDDSTSATSGRVKSSERSAEMQKVFEEAYRATLPKAIRREAEEREALEREKAALAQAELDKKLAEGKERRQVKLGWVFWGSASMVFLIGIAWLFYAPFFLAFALQMTWIDEETRNRWDPAAAVRAKLSMQTPEKKDVTAGKQTVPSEMKQEEGLNYTFYQELPKDHVSLGAQPLPVRTKSPTYLQLASIANEKEAQAERKRFASKGHLVQLATQSNAKNQTVYVLRMGPYEDQRVINRIKVELQKLGVDAQEVSVLSVIKSQDQAPQTRQAQAENKSKIAISANEPKPESAKIKPLSTNSTKVEEKKKP